MRNCLPAPLRSVILFYHAFDAVFLSSRPKISNMLKALFNIILAVLLILPSGAYAWGPLGHRIVGEIADSYLTPKARKAIEKILGNESLAISSTWADFVKADSAYLYLSPWHYINFKAGTTYEEMQRLLLADTGTNAYTKLNFLIRELKNPGLQPEMKKMYLRLLVHIAGDIHQPLHTGRPEDLGGNRVRVSWFGTPSNLHRVWDEHLIESQQLSYTEYVKSINFTTRDQRSKWQTQPITEWFFESYEICNKIYAQVNKPEESLGYRYNYVNIDTLNQQLLKGGVRLAGLLNEIFG